MNKPTREQIEHRAVENMLNQGGFISSLIQAHLEKAEKELTPSILTSNQQRILRGKLQALGEVTGHKYDTIQYIEYPSNDYKSIRLGYISSKDGYRYEDTITGGTFIKFADDVFKKNEFYEIKDLLNG